MVIPTLARPAHNSPACRFRFQLGCTAAHSILNAGLAVHRRPRQGYGTGSLDRDAADLRLLCQHLRASHDVTGVVLLGHSTGCQDAIRYVQRYGPAADLEASGSQQAPELLATILQAPVRWVDYLVTTGPRNDESNIGTTCAKLGGMLGLAA